MIIGEDLQSAIRNAGISTPAISVEIHAGFPENIDGVIATLEPAAAAGWISADELLRQKRLLASANEVERLRGAASKPYIEPSRGDLKHLAAQRLLALARSGMRGVAIMNAKKETAYMFADELLALHQACPAAPITYIANLEDRGLPKVREDARRIREELRENDLVPVLCGALDEYGANGETLGREIQALSPEFAFIVGVPHAIPPEFLRGIECVSVTNGPRQVEPLKEQGHRYVVVEIDLHPRTLGVTHIVESELGAVIRSMA